MNGMFRILGVVIPIAVAVGYYIYSSFEQPSNRHQNYSPSGRESGGEARRCYICLQDTRRAEGVVLPCHHSFCLDCMRPLISGTQVTCPECRVEIPPALIMALKERMRPSYF